MLRLTMEPWRLTRTIANEAQNIGVKASVGDSRIVDEDQYPELYRSEESDPELHVGEK
jgi:hypothetical protein